MRSNNSSLVLRRVFVLAAAIYIVCANSDLAPPCRPGDRHTEHAKRWSPLVLEVKITNNEGGQSSATVVYKSIDYWRVEQRTIIAGLALLDVSLSDGSKVWSYSILRGEIGHIEKTDPQHKEIRQKQLAKAIALLNGLTGIAFIGDPERSPWKADFGCLVKGFGSCKKGVEQTINGTACTPYKWAETDDNYLLSWFGKEDGILRRQVAHLGKMRIEMNVVSIRKRAKIPPETFSFRPPAGAAVEDGTASLIAQVKRALEKK